MGRMYGKGKGISSSATPYRRRAPTWVKMKTEDVSDHICKLAKKGLTPSQIGVTLRDSFGIPQVKTVTGNKILRILKINGLAPELPEDMYYLIKKAVSIRKHLDKSRKDKDAKFRLILVESRIHRLARYYKRVKALPAVWKYVSATAAALVS
uniref:Ribosomal protein S13 n=1 Tax=Kryptoperidinium triquetrum TaxID=66468 RepID=A8I1Q6_KRYTR|nr:ribosomal protein S13 [Heterocapsa triquetra]